MFKKILFADDLSKRALKGLQVALDLCRKYSAELNILNVRENFLNKDEMVMLRVDVSDFQDDMKAKALSVRHKIQSDIESLGGQGVKSQIILREGKPHQVIIDVAAELGADLIVIGTLGVTTLKDKLFGSTIEGVACHAGRSVMVVWTGE